MSRASVPSQACIHLFWEKSPFDRNYKVKNQVWLFFSEDLNDKNNEVFDLKVKVEVLEKVVEEVVNRVESNHTPTKKNSKKGRKVRQSPSSVHEAVDEREDPEEGILGSEVPS